MIYLPGWSWILLAGGIYLFYATNRSRRIRKQNRRERLDEKHRELLGLLKKGESSEPANHKNNKLSDNEHRL